MKKNDDFLDAIIFGNVEEVQLFIRDGIDVNSLDENGRSPLFNAIFNKAPAWACELLIQAGADVNFASKRDINIWSQVIYYADEEQRFGDERDWLAKELIKSGRLNDQKCSYYTKMKEELALHFLMPTVEVVENLDPIFVED